MFCNNCGREVANGTRFCTYCGSPMGGAPVNPGMPVRTAPQPRGGMPMGGRRRIKSDRSLLMCILLSIITFGIYGLYFYYAVAKDINEICEGDGEHTGGLIARILLTFLTCGLYSFYWDYKFQDRLAENGMRYGVMVHETGSTVLLWDSVGVLLCGIGPFVALNIMIKNLNKLAAAYNAGLR